MKNVLKYILPVFMVLVTVFSLAGCSGVISGNEAKAFINGFFDAVEAKDYNRASAFLHPDVTDDLKTFFEGMENKYDLDFSLIDITKYTGFYSTLYDSKIGGSVYRLSMNVKVGDKEVQMQIQVVRNDDGYGIYNLNITP